MTGKSKTFYFSKRIRKNSVIYDQEQFITAIIIKEGILMPETNDGEIEKILSSSEAYDFVASLGIPVIHGGGSKATIELLEMIDFSENQRVLDVGCGSGYTACLIVEKYGSDVIGIDISMKMIDNANQRKRKRNLGDKVNFQVTDVYKLPFEDNYFDIVIIESVLTPLHNEKKALDKISRVLKTDGNIGLNEGIFSPDTPDEFKNQLLRHPSFSGQILIKNSLEILFENTGFVITDYREKDSELNLIRELGVKGIISFMVRKYPGIAYRMFTDSRFRKYQRFDEKIIKESKKYANFALIIAKKLD